MPVVIHQQPPWGIISIHMRIGMWDVGSGHSCPPHTLPTLFPHSSHATQMGRLMSDMCKPSPRAPWSLFYGPEGWCQAEKPVLDMNLTSLSIYKQVLRPPPYL